MKKLLTAMAAVVLAVASLPFSAGPAFAATYPGDCDAGTHPSSNYIRFKDYRVSSVTAVKGTTVVRDLQPCINGSTKGGWTGVWVNAQNPELVQLGYMEVASGWSFNNVTGRKFVWVPNPASGGIYEKVTWFESGVPTVGNVYRFEITNVANLSGGRRWQFCIYNQTKGTSGCSTGSITSTTSVDQPWWGFETYNSKDVLGTRSTLSSQALLTNLAYRRSGGSWTTLPSAAVCSSIGSQADYRCSEPSPDSIRGYTISD